MSFFFNYKSTFFTVQSMYNQKEVFLFPSLPISLGNFQISECLLTLHLDYA